MGIGTGEAAKQPASSRRHHLSVLAGKACTWTACAGSDRARGQSTSRTDRTAVGMLFATSQDDTFAVNLSCVHDAVG